MEKTQLNEAIMYASILDENRDNLKPDADVLVALDLAAAVLAINEKNAELKQKLGERTCTS